MSSLFSDNRNIAVLPNPTRGAAKQIGRDIALLLSGFDVQHSLFEDSWPAAFSSFTDVWIIGGDGTLNYFVNHYQDIRLPLSIFKGGTGNDFHWMLYGEIGVEEQVERILAGNTALVDAGKCNDRLFMNNLGIGFDARVTRDLMQKEKVPGKTEYYWSVLKHIFTFREFSGTIQHQQETASDSYFMVSVSNGQRTGGGFYLSPKASLHDGQLDVNVVTKIHPIKRLLYLPVIEKGKHQHRKFSFLKHYQTKSIGFTAVAPVHAHVDGEYFMESTFDVMCLPGRFTFLV